MIGEQGGELVDDTMRKIRREQAVTNDIGDYGKLETIIRNAINAALAAERKANGQDREKWMRDIAKGAKLQQQLAAEREIVGKVWQALGVETFEQAKGKTIWELVYAEREKVEECTRLLALAQEQQEELVTVLKKIRTLTNDVEICALIDATFINLK